MGYSKGPYLLHSSLPVPDRPTVVSARSINFATGRYELDDKGSFERMPPVDQRVVILAGRAIGKTTFNTVQEHNRIRKDIINSLSIMTDYPTPIVKLSEVLVGSEFPGHARAQITFTDLTRNTGIDQKVQIP